MRARKVIVISIPAIITAILVAVVLVPSVLTPGGTHTVCGPAPSYCGQVVQYGSLSYAYGGFGAVYQSGVNSYSVESWVCSCPAQIQGKVVPCCVPPLAGLIGPAVGVLLLADTISLIILFVESGRRKPSPSPPVMLRQFEGGLGSCSCSGGRGDFVHFVYARAKRITLQLETCFQPR
jgi:hypothetical protein